MNKWEIESKITSNFDGMLTQGQQEVVDYIEKLQQKVNQLETNRDEAIELNKKINNLVAFGDSENKLPDLVWELSSILGRGKEWN